MTETKRFWILNTLTEYSGIKDKDKLLTFNEVVDLLNELHDEKEAWKQSCCSNSNFNSILLRELDIAIEQGYEVSNPFKQFLEDREDVK